MITKYCMVSSFLKSCLLENTAQSPWRNVHAVLASYRDCASLPIMAKLSMAPPPDLLPAIRLDHRNQFFDLV